MRLALISATNNDRILEENLLRSEVVKSKRCRVILQRGYRNLSKAYNDAILAAPEEYLCFLHQDVFLPDGWDTQLLRAIQSLQHENWGVIGIAGVKLINQEEVFHGHLLDRGKHLGTSTGLPAPVDTLDEVLLVIKNNFTLRFDERIPGAHFYGADVCLQAASQGLKCFAVDAFCHHNSTNGRTDTPEFTSSAEYMQRKWRHRLPFATTCILLEPRWRTVTRRLLNPLGVLQLRRLVRARLKTPGVR